MKNWLVHKQLLLSEQIANATLPHAMLISGVSGSGKFELANWLIQILLCQFPEKSNEGISFACNKCKPCKLFKNQAYPDHLSVVSDKNSIGVDNIRNASQFFEKTAQLGDIKTVLIPCAETMTISAANALLKTLEEPSANSFIILLSTEPDTLLPTIISRCRLIEIRPPVGKALLEHLGQEYDNSFANLSHIPELSCDKTEQKYLNFQQTMILYLQCGSNKSQWLKEINSSEHSLRWMEKVIVNLMRRQYGWIENREQDKIQKVKVDNNKIWQIYTKIQSTVKKIKMLSQVNEQFMLEKLVVDIEHILITKLN